MLASGLLHFLVGDEDQFSCKMLNFSFCLLQPNTGVWEAIVPAGQGDWGYVVAHSVPLTAWQQKQSTLLISTSSLLRCGAATLLVSSLFPFHVVGWNLGKVWQIGAAVRENEEEGNCSCIGVGVGCCSIWSSGGAYGWVTDIRFDSQSWCC